MYTFNLKETSEAFPTPCSTRMGALLLDELLAFSNAHILNQKEIPVLAEYGHTEKGTEFESFSCDKWFIKINPAYSGRDIAACVRYDLNWECVNFEFEVCTTNFKAEEFAEDALVYEEMYRTYIKPYVNAFKNLSNKKLVITIDPFFNPRIHAINSCNLTVKIGDDNEVKMINCTCGDLLAKIVHMTGSC